MQVKPGDRVSLRFDRRRVRPHQSLGRGRLRAGAAHAGRHGLPHRRLQVRPNADRRQAGRLRAHRAHRRRAACCACSRTPPTPSGRATRSPSESSAKRLRRSSRAPKAASSIASFASNVPRIQQAVDHAERFGRKVAFLGRSMHERRAFRQRARASATSRRARRSRSKTSTSYPPEQVVVMTTGSQGEPMSGLARMSVRDHQEVPHRAGRHGRDQRDADSRQREERLQDDQQPLQAGRDTSFTEPTATSHVSGPRFARRAAADAQPRAAGVLRAGPRRVPHAGARTDAWRCRPASIRATSSSSKTATCSSSPREYGDKIGKTYGGNVIVDGSGVGDVGEAVLARSQGALQRRHHDGRRRRSTPKRRA